MHLPQPIQSRHQPVREFHGSGYKKGLLRGALSCTSRQQADFFVYGGHPRPLAPRLLSLGPAPPALRWRLLALLIPLSAPFPTKSAKTVQADPRSRGLQGILVCTTGRNRPPVQANPLYRSPQGLSPCTVLAENLRCLPKRSKGCGSVLSGPRRGPVAAFLGVNCA